MIRGWWNCGIYNMSNISQIAEGFFNNVFDKRKMLYDERIKICRACPLLKVDNIFGEVCNKSLYINKEGKTSKTPKDGYVRGCGCVLASKTRVDEAHCVINKW